MESAKLLLRDLKLDSFPFAFKYSELKALIIKRIKDPLGGFILGSRFISYKSTNEFQGETSKLIEVNPVTDFQIRFENALKI
jgi:hypothetical protein